MAQIEAFVDNQGQSLVGELVNGETAAAKHVGQLFEVS